MLINLLLSMNNYYQEKCVSREAQCLHAHADEIGVTFVLENGREESKLP